MKKILFLTKYTKAGVNSRYRTFQYLPYLIKNGIDVTTSPLFNDKYIKYIYRTGHHFLKDVIYAYLKRIFSLLNIGHYDLIVIEREILPYIPGFFEWIVSKFNVPYILDYDDATFHHYDTNKIVKFFLGSKIKNIIKNASLIITGSSYLTNYAKKTNQNIVEIPTVIDLNRYSSEQTLKNDIFTIGWIGSPYTDSYLLEIYPALNRFCTEHKCRINLIGAHEKIKEKFKNLPVNIIKWSEDSEIEEMQKFNVGIMPLPNTQWTQGKCGFKLIQYMGCFLPVIASPIGVNKNIVKENTNGYLADTKERWLYALNELFNDKKLQKEMGLAGRKIVEKNYSFQVMAPYYLKTLLKVIEEQ